MVYIRIDMANMGDNIFFFIEEKTEENNNLSEIEQMLCELEDVEDVEDVEVVKNESNADLPENTNIYYSTKKIYEEDYGINNEEFYKQYTIKELLKIWHYYGIKAHVKSSECKKEDIISCIVYFESLPENESIVLKRHMMWSYILELRLDAKMKKYIIW